MKLISYIFIILLTACILSCGDKKVIENTISETTDSVIENAKERTGEWVPDEYKTSELAELMRTMHKENMILKSRIEAGELDLKKESDYSFIYEAEATDPADKNTLFKIYSEAFIRAENKVYESKTNLGYKKNFNAMVNACIGCHQNFCMGPIAKIELLRIK